MQVPNVSHTLLKHRIQGDLPQNFSGQKGRRSKVKEQRFRGDAAAPLTC